MLENNCYSIFIYDSVAILKSNQHIFCKALSIVKCLDLNNDLIKHLSLV